MIQEVRNGTFTIYDMVIPEPDDPDDTVFGKITIKSADAQKYYDGTPLTAESYEITCSKNPEEYPVYPPNPAYDMAYLRSAFTVNVYGSQTVMGESLNYFTFTIDESILEPWMYLSIEKVEGKLIVLSPGPAN